MSTEYTKENDYTICATTTREDIRDGDNCEKSFDHKRTCKKFFNFYAAQVTTETEIWVGAWDDGYSYDTAEAGATSVALTSTTQNFDDIQSTIEIEMMHKKLLDLGGKPPALENVLGQRYFPKSKTKGLG